MYYQPSDATREIKRRLRNGGEVIFTDHVQEQMCKRHIDGQEVVAAIKSGTVREAGEEKKGEFCYKMESNLSGGIAVVVAIPDDDPNVIAVTTFSPLSKKKRV